MINISRQGHKRLEPEGEGCLWQYSCIYFHLLYSDWSLLLLVNTHGSFQLTRVCYYKMVNMVACRKHYLQLPVVRIYKFCQCMEKNTYLLPQCITPPTYPHFLAHTTTPIFWHILHHNKISLPTK